MDEDRPYCTRLMAFVRGTSSIKAVLKREALTCMFYFLITLEEELSATDAGKACPSCLVLLEAFSIIVARHGCPVVGAHLLIL